MDAYACPFCGLEVDETHPAVVTPLRVFELHLDGHMERGDRLPKHLKGAAA